jgi:hypothetical protein
MLLEGIAGKFVQKINGILSLSLTGLTSLRVVQSECEGDEATRAGIRYQCMGATGIAPVQAIPTTAAAWLLYNPLGNSVTAFLDMIGVVNITGVSGAGGTLYGCIVGPKYVPTAVPTISQANAQIMNCNPLAARGSNLVLVVSQTLQNVTVPMWSPIAYMNPNQTVAAQAQIENRDVRGKHILTPGSGLALTVLSPTGTSPLFAPYITWREYTADTE